MPKRTPEPRLWRRIARELDGFDERLLIELVRDLYKLSPENRAFLAARFGDEDEPTALLDEYKKKITRQFFSRGVPRYRHTPDFALCRKLIKEYRRVTTRDEIFGDFDVRGTIDLGLHYIETGVAFLSEIGWDEERPYNSLGAVVEETAELCRGESGRGLAGVFLPRVLTLAKSASNFGYGFSDDLEYLAEVFEKTAAQWSCQPGIATHLEK